MSFIFCANVQINFGFNFAEWINYTIFAKKYREQ